MTEGMSVQASRLSTVLDNTAGHLDASVSGLSGEDGFALDAQQTDFRIRL